MRNGEQIRFLKDSWIGELSLAHLYQNLFALALQPEITVAETKGEPSTQARKATDSH